jgi:type I restriction enzyme R subunit
LGILADRGLDLPEGILVAESVANGLLDEYLLGARVTAEVLHAARRTERRSYLWCDDGDIDEIVRHVRFPEWQTTSAGEREVKKALRRTLFKYKLHQDKELFTKADGYIKQYY